MTDIMKCVVCDEYPEIFEAYFSHGNNIFSIKCEQCCQNIKAFMIKTEAIEKWNKQQQKAIDRIRGEK